MISDALRWATSISICFILISLAGLQTANAQTKEFNVPAQSATTGIPEFARQAGIQILVSEPLVRGKQTATVKGSHTVPAALEILLKGTGLAATSRDGTTFTLATAPAPQASLNRATPVPGNSTTTENQSLPKKDKKESKSSDEEKIGLTEIVVTGTYLHRTDPITPLITLSHDDIVTQGYTTLTQVFDQLPQNFKFGASPESFPAAGGLAASQNFTYATGVNLRGLGTAATLVLLNGKRLAQTVYGGIVDVSQIPVSVIDHVDILTDGASSLYGSDAVAGVVNIITKKDFSGFQVGGRVNSITDGKTPNSGGNMLAGYSWSTGNITANFDYEKDNPLVADKRSATATLPEPFWLLPRSEAYNLYVSLQNDFADRLSLSVDALATKKNFTQTYTFATETPYDEFGKVSQYSLSSELNYRISSDWTAVLIAQGSEEIDHETQLFPVAFNLIADQNPVEYKVYSLESRVDGPLFQAAGGAARMAFGAQFRHEALKVSGFEGLVTPPTVQAQLALGSSRHLSSAYGELQVPLIGSDNAMRLAQKLRIDLSGRYDDYSDFGRTTNPRGAIEWIPITGLALHTSYSRSFQAPALYQASNASLSGDIYEAPDPQSPTGTRLSAVVTGTNPNLQPETAKSFTFGVTYEPNVVGGLKIDATFYSIDFKNRITDLGSYFSTFVQQAAVLGPFVNLNPTIAQINQVLSQPNRIFYDDQNGCHVGTAGCPPVDPATIKAIAYLDAENAASVNVRGIDFAAHYAGEPTLFGRFRSDLDGTFFTTYRQRVAPGAAEASLQNTVYNPVRFRAKANIGWVWTYWGANARVNYANAYDNNIDPNCAVTGTCKVASWATVDVSFAYTSARSTGLRVGLDFTNLFDRAPPYLSSLPNSGNWQYDSTNANPFGRMIGITFTKTWGFH